MWLLRRDGVLFNLDRTDFIEVYATGDGEFLRIWMGKFSSSSELGKHDLATIITGIKENKGCIVL